jgi:hypothetical protein
MAAARRRSRMAVAKSSIRKCVSRPPLDPAPSTAAGSGARRDSKRAHSRAASKTRRPEASLPRGGTKIARATSLYSADPAGGSKP